MTSTFCNYAHELNGSKNRLTVWIFCPRYFIILSMHNQWRCQHTSFPCVKLCKKGQISISSYLRFLGEFIGYHLTITIFDDKNIKKISKRIIRCWWNFASQIPWALCLNGTCNAQRSYQLPYSFRIFYCQPMQKWNTETIADQAAMIGASKPLPRTHIFDTGVDLSKILWG